MPSLMVVPAATGLSEKLSPVTFVQLATITSFKSNFVSLFSFRSFSAPWLFLSFKTFRVCRKQVDLSPPSPFSLSPFWCCRICLSVFGSFCQLWDAMLATCNAHFVSRWCTAALALQAGFQSDRQSWTWSWQGRSTARGPSAHACTHIQTHTHTHACTLNRVGGSQAVNTSDQACSHHGIDEAAVKRFQLDDGRLEYRNTLAKILRSLPP